MKQFKAIYICAILSMSIIFLAGDAMAGPNDPVFGKCDDLDVPSGLYSTCIQAHSAASRVDRLLFSGASEITVTQAIESFIAAVAKFEELGGGQVPGFDDCPCFEAEDLKSPFTQSAERCFDGISSEYFVFTSLEGLNGPRINLAEAAVANGANQFGSACTYFTEELDVSYQSISTGEVLRCRDLIVAECADRELLD